LDIYHPDTPYLREKECEDPWLFFEVTRVSRAKSLITLGWKVFCNVLLKDAVSC